MASVRDTNIAETLLTAIVLWNEFDIAKIEALRLSRIEIWGVRFTNESSVFSIMTGWIAEVLFLLFYAYTAE